MAIFSKAAFTALFLASSYSNIGRGATATLQNPAEGMVTDTDATIPVEPVENFPDTANTLIASFSSTEGLDNIQNHIKEAKAQGKAVGLKNVKKFKNPQGKGRGNGGGENGSGGNGGENGGGNGKNDKVSGGGNDNVNKNKNKRHLVGTDASIGYAVIETTPDVTDAELEAIFSLTGVTNVEHDVELTVAEVKGLRGHHDESGGMSAQDHIRAISEAMMREQANLPNHDVENEYAPIDQEHRHLAESRPWGIDLVNVTHLWSIPPQQHVKICVIDTGYQLGHEDLPFENVTGWDTGVASKGVWNVDGHSHGTHCAGTIGAVGNNGLGVVGVNPDPTKFSFHIAKGLSDSGSGAGNDVINAVNDCVDKGAKVISMSLGCSNCYVQVYDNAYRDAYDAGVLIIAAAGNTGADTVHYPSAYESVISVASVRENSGEGAANYGELSSFSTRSQQTEIAGPGHFVQSTVPGGYGSKSGTSMACPHVAGVAALLVSHFPDCTNNQIRNAMIGSTREPPTGDSKNSPGWDKYYGWGIVNAGKAYELLSQGCEIAGGAYPDEAAGQTLSMMALGGSTQKQIGCTSDEHCFDANLCNGEQKCNVISNTCYIVEGTVPDCNDNVKCTIDTCDPSIPITNGVTDMCVHTPMSCEDGNKCNGVYVCEEASGTCVIDEPVVDCDDGSACTIDKCVTSTGLCEYTDKTCDDANDCTLNDHCDPAVGCVFATPKPLCCGNADCEANESQGTCPQDCSDGISTISVPATYGYLGNIFNIETKSRNMTITGVGVHCTLPEGVMGTVHVYSKAGDHFSGGAWYSSSQWKLIIQKDVGCAGIGSTTQVSFQNLVDIPKYTRQAFNIFVLTEDMNTYYPTVRAYYGSGGKYALVKEDSYIKVEVGSGNRCTTGFCSISTPIAYSGSIDYIAIDDSPTLSPTVSSMPTTPFPTTSPTKPTTSNPTTSPTKNPTDLPTTSPTKKPTENPTESPTAVPSVSFQPTEFVPEVVNLVKDTNSATIVKAAYLEVQGGDAWAKITNLKIITYGTRSLEVYYKYGSASPYEATPCAWKKVAETSSSWNPGYWKRVWPSWVNGFEPVVLPPNEKVSFYLVNTGISYGILAASHSNANRYLSPWMSLDATSPVGAIKMSYGRGGYADQRFNPNPTSYSGYGIWGGLQLETMQPGSTEAPTTAPTEPTSPGLIESSLSGEMTEMVNGLQFEVENIGSDDIIVKKFSVLMAEAGTHHIEVWYRNGSYKGSPSGCNNWSNWCNNWTKVKSENVYSSGRSSFTSTSTFVAIAKAKATTSFAIVSATGHLLTKTVTTGVVNNGFLQINLAKPIEDYYAENVQTSYDLSISDVLFEGTIDYDIAHSECAILSKAPWVVLDANGASSMGSDSEAEEGDGEVLMIVHDNSNQNEGPVDGGGSGGFEEELLS